MFARAHTPPSTNDGMNRSWTTSTAGKLAQQEFPYQRMHRQPNVVGPPDMGTTDRSVYRSSFAERDTVPVPANVGARYTVGTKNALGTHINYNQVELDELKLGRVHLGDAPRQWQSEFSAHFAAPDLAHPAHGLKAQRGGKAPRMPFSEVERRFGSLDSTGTMPGMDGRTEGTSEQREQYANPGRQPAVEPILTLGTQNDIGSCTHYQASPAVLKDMTHYTLGNVPTKYVTTCMDATAPHPPPADRPYRASAGQLPPVGPSEVEQGFRQQYSSRHINIITGGERLHGASNADAAKHAANSAAFERPVGRKQHPNVAPSDRGPSGHRQSYDIITGVERPKERW